MASNKVKHFWKRILLTHPADSTQESLLSRKLSELTDSTFAQLQFALLIQGYAFMAEQLESIKLLFETKLFCTYSYEYANLLKLSHYLVQYQENLPNNNAFRYILPGTTVKPITWDTAVSVINSILNKSADIQQNHSLHTPQQIFITTSNNLNSLALEFISANYY